MVDEAELLRQKLGEIAKSLQECEDVVYAKSFKTVNYLELYGKLSAKIKEVTGGYNGKTDRTENGRVPGSEASE